MILAVMLEDFWVNFRKVEVPSASTFRPTTVKILTVLST